MKTHLQKHKERQGTRDTAIRCTKEEDKTRQEWKKEADINYIVQRVMAGHVVPTRPMSNGIADYTQDMDTMYQAADALGDQYNALPEKLKAQISPQDFLNRALNLQSLDPAQLDMELQDLSQKDTTEDTPKP